MIATETRRPEITTYRSRSCAAIATRDLWPTAVIDGYRGLVRLPQELHPSDRKIRYGESQRSVFDDLDCQPMKTKPILRWPGGKSRHLKTILPLIQPHVCYVEPFAGGLAVLLAKERSAVEIVNDTNRDIVSLYRCARFHMKPLIDETEWMLAARVNFHDYRDNAGLTDIQRAARFLVLNITSFAGDSTTFGVSKTKGGGVALDRQRIVSRLTALNDRLNKVVVECLDWERCVRLYDSPDTLFFFDPPYLNAKVRAYKGWTEEQMEHMASVLPTLKGQWILTVDGSEFCQTLFAPWKCQLVNTRNRATNQRINKSMFSELIITSEAAQ